MRKATLPAVQPARTARQGSCFTHTHCQAIFIYLYCIHLSLYISWDEANFPSQDKLFLLNSAKSICSQDNFCYCLTQIFWKGKSSPFPLTPAAGLLRMLPGDAPATKGTVSIPTNSPITCELPRALHPPPPLQTTWKGCTSSPTAPAKAIRHRSVSSTHVLFSGFLATGLSVISGILSENAGGELISGWLSGAAAKRQLPQALFALGTWCRLTDLSSVRGHVCIIDSGMHLHWLAIWGKIL